MKKKFVMEVPPIDFGDNVFLSIVAKVPDYIMADSLNRLYDLNLHRVNDTNIGLRGSGDINVNFNNDCGSVDCQLNGSGDINLSGRVSRFHMEKHGSGDIDIDNLSIEK